MTSYIIAAIFAGAMILIAAVISNMIQFEGGSNPKDPGKRKMWFWIMAVLNPIIFFIVARFVLAPKADDDQMIFDDYLDTLPIAAGICFVLYIIIGFVLSKVFKNGKLGNWF